MSIPVLIALLVCLIPTTIGGLLSAIGIAGMDRMIQQNVIAMSGRAVEAAGDVNTLLLDKTGTITLGNRQAVEFIPVPGVDAGAPGGSRAARVAPRRDARRAEHRRAREGASSGCAAARLGDADRARHMKFVPFSAATRMSGVNAGTLQMRKGRGRCGRALGARAGRRRARRARPQSMERIAREGGTPLVVAEQ